MSEFVPTITDVMDAYVKSRIGTTKSVDLAVALQGEFTAWYVAEALAFSRLGFDSVCDVIAEENVMIDGKPAKVFAEQLRAQNPFAVGDDS